MSLIQPLVSATILGAGAGQAAAGEAAGGAAALAHDAELSEAELTRLMETPQVSGDRDFPELTREMTTYRLWGQGDVVLDTAASRLGVSISDAVVIAGNDLVLSGKLFKSFEEIAGMSASQRHDALLEITDSTIVTEGRAGGHETDVDFHIMMFRNGPAPSSDNQQRLYRFYLREGKQAKVAFPHYGSDSNRKLREGTIRKERGDLAITLKKARTLAKKGGQDGLIQLLTAKQQAVRIEAMSRSLDMTAAASGASRIIGMKEDKMLGLLWECMETARDAIISGCGLPKGFDASLESLDLFLRGI